MAFSVANLWERFKGEFKTSTFGVFLSVILTYILNRLLKDLSLYEQLIIMILLFISFYLVLISIKLKRDLTEKLHHLDHFMRITYGSTTSNQFFNRAEHWAEEKSLIANRLVKRCIPDVIQKTKDIFQSAYNTPPNGITFLVDSGTTITPFFYEIRHHEFLKDKKIKQKVKIFTNSISGVTQFNAISNAGSSISEENLYLLGGIPRATYRATSGGIKDDPEFCDLSTEKELEKVSKISLSRGNIIISIVNGNWLTVGHNFDNLGVCAKGQGHLEFKEGLYKYCHAAIVIGPLGKLLSRDGLKALNEVMKSEGIPEYNFLRMENTKDSISKSFDSIDDVASDSRHFFDQCFEKKIYLLTSHRTENDSPLFNHSSELFKENSSRTFEVCDKKISPRYTPPGPPETQIHLEFPHTYIRNAKTRFFA